MAICEPTVNSKEHYQKVLCREILRKSEGCIEVEDGLKLSYSAVSVLGILGLEPHTKGFVAEPTPRAKKHIDLVSQFGNTKARLETRIGSTETVSKLTLNPGAEHSDIHHIVVTTYHDDTSKELGRVDCLVGSVEHGSYGLTFTSSAETEGELLCEVTHNGEPVNLSEGTHPEFVTTLATSREQELFSNIREIVRSLTQAV